MRFWLLPMVAIACHADISGFVLEDSTGNPISGARVHLQAEPDIFVFSAADGSYLLPVNPGLPVKITASVHYDPLNPVNYIIGGTDTTNGSTNVEIRLVQLPGSDVIDLTQASSSDCANCHAEQFFSWFFSAHAGAGTDEWVRDLYSGDGTPGGNAGYVFRDLHDANDTGLCATCHTALADIQDPGNVFLDEVTDSIALEGVNCIACHKIAHVNNNVNGLNHLGNSTYRFPDGPEPTWQYVWGPLDDVTYPAMQASHQSQFSDSIFCASCHQYTNPTNGAPGQSTYEEWLLSPFAVPGPNYQSCQDCHMPQLPADVICSVGTSIIRPPERNRDHGIASASMVSLSASIDLATSLSDMDGQLTVSAMVSNVGAGHNFPAGVSIRNAFVVVEAWLNGQPLSQIDGSTIPFWASDDVPGEQPGDYAGMPGRGFAKVLQGRINGQGPVVRPVLFIDAESVYEDSAIPSGGSVDTPVVFAVPGFAVAGDTVLVRSRVIYRRAWRALAVTKGWTETPQGTDIELEIARIDDNYVLTNDGILPQVPTMGHWGRLILIAGLLSMIVWHKKRVA